MRKILASALLSLLLGLLAGCPPPGMQKPTVRPVWPAENTTNQYTPYYHGNSRSPAPKYPSGGGQSLAGKVIIVDAGHGGKDPGAPNKYGPAEKMLTLPIAEKLADELARRGAKVIMTRRSDRFISLDRRAEIAEQYHADLLVSIHADKSSNPGIKGVTILLGRRASSRSKRAAQAIRSALQRAHVSCRGIRSQRLRVLDAHSRPAVLIECGFLSNRSESTLLSQTWYQNKLSKAIAEGISSYFHY